MLKLKHEALLHRDFAGEENAEEARPTPATLRSLVCTMTSLLHHLVINNALPAS